MAKGNPNLKAGPGRPPGALNKSTKDVQAVIDRVFAANGGEDFLWAKFLGGDNGDRIFQLMVHYKYGKPKESVTVDVSSDMVNLISEARQRAKE
jgi:hypothetical protein